MNSLQIDQLATRIDQAFGEDTPFTEQALSEHDVDTLNRVFADDGYQRYLQDQVNRQIIRDYLTNAVLLKFVSEEALTTLTERAGSVSGRATLSLHMLMSAVDQAESLAAAEDAELVPLQPGGRARPHLNLIKS